jgi:Family of unknown function (DUF6152)
MQARRDFGTLVLAGLALLADARTVLAHHAFAAEYNANRRITLTGNVTKVEWMNPHAHCYLDVRDASGKVTTWDLELASPNVLQREGWTRKTIKVGDVVTINGYLAKDGTNLAHARDVRLADGRKVFAGAAPDGAPAQ